MFCDAFAGGKGNQEGEGESRLLALCVCPAAMCDINRAKCMSIKSLFKA